MHHRCWAQLAKSGKRSSQLLPLFDAYMWKGALYLVMPLCVGGKFEVMAGWSEGHCAGVAAQIAKALHHMHNLGCVHNDIKPQNLLLLDEFAPPRIVVADYGESLIADDEEKGLKAPNATLIFAPPEWMGGNCDYSRATDIYSLGVTISFLLTGRPPFDPTLLLSTHKADPAAALRLPGSCVALNETSLGMRSLPSEDAKDFVRQCCQFDPEKRPTAKDVLAHPWIAKWGHGTVADKNMLKLAAQIKMSLGRLQVADAVGKGTRRSGADSDMREVCKEVEAVAQTIPIEALRSRFHDMVGEGNEMTMDKFQELMTSIECDSLPIGRLFTVFDTDSSGGISFKELVKGIGVIQQEDVHSRVGLVFELYDSDGDGKLSPIDIQEALGSVATEYCAHPVFKASVAKLSALLSELVDAEGNVGRAGLTQAVIANRELLRLFLSPAEQAKEVEKQRRLTQWHKALFGIWAESIIFNPYRSAYVVLALVVLVLLALHMIGIINVDACGNVVWTALDLLLDSPGAVDGPGDTVGDMDYELSADATMLRDID